MPTKTKTFQHAAAPGKTIFRFEVQILSGPITRSFATKCPEAPSRIIDIRGSQTLDDLHEAIFEAFDRDDPHMYEFQIGGKKPMDRKAVRYGLVFEDDIFADSDTENVDETSIASLHLTIGAPFFYWFDFGDDWWHQVRLLAVDPPAKGKGRYPRIVEKKGESPPQYADWDQEEESDPDADDELISQDAGNLAATMARERFGEIFALVEDFCQSNLTTSYAQVGKKLLEAVYAAWLPVDRGKAASWAAGIVHAAGMINFLHDPASEPYMKLRDLAPHFGVSAATMESKSREIRDAVKPLPLDPRFCLPERLIDNPLIWMQEVDGMFIDLRTQPREAQEAAFKAGLIPFIPEKLLRLSPEESPESGKKKK